MRRGPDVPLHLCHGRLSLQLGCVQNALCMQPLALIVGAGVNTGQGRQAGQESSTVLGNAKQQSDTDQC